MAAYHWTPPCAREAPAVRAFSGEREPRSGRIAWQHKFPNNDLCYSGTATTAGNLVFVGRSHGYLQAYNAKTGKLLWTSPKLGGGANAAPMTYTSNGSQYVAVYAGGNGLLALVNTKFHPDAGVSLYTFKLPASAK